MQTTPTPIGDIKLNPSNPRTISGDKFDKLVASIRAFPQMLQLRPIVTNDDGVVLGGNMRLKACQAAGLEIVPVIKASELTDEQQRRFIIADNVAYGEWDAEMLVANWNADELAEWGVEIPEYDPPADFEPEKIADERETTEDDYEAPEDLSEVATAIRAGDLIEIGPHRLICGDARDPRILDRLMSGARADLGFNDPPYGWKKEGEGITNDNLNFDDLLQFNREWIELQLQHLAPNGSFYCWGLDEPLMETHAAIFRPRIDAGELYFRNLVTWDKGSGQNQLAPSGRSYAKADEKCLFYMLGTSGFNSNSANFYEGFEPIRAYLEGERAKVGWNAADLTRILGVTTGTHYFSRSQWMLPTRENYAKLQAAAKGAAFLKTYGEVRGEKSAAESGAIYDEHKQGFEAVRREFYDGRAYFDNLHDNMNNVWHFNRENPELDHATPKPLAVCGRAIKSSCKAGGLVLDCFCGSGSTMVAAHQLDRICYAVEIEPRYCQLTVDRMLRQDPGLLVKINGRAVGAETVDISDIY
jgi:DNA modification methylase